MVKVNQYRSYHPSKLICPKSKTTKNQQRAQRPVKSARTNLPMKQKNVTVAPAAISKKARTKVPKIKRLPNGETIISHCEYFFDLGRNTTVVYPTSGAALLNTHVNPANPVMFPWLSSIAPNYESYRFESLEVEYQPQCGSATDGVVMMAIDYDPSDAPAISKTQLMSYESSVKGAAWQNFSHVSKKPNLAKQKEYYPEYSVNPSTSPSVLRQNNVGTLEAVAIGQGGDAPTVIGELFVHYVIRLKTPQIPTGYNARALSIHISNSSDLTVGSLAGNFPIQVDDSNTLRFLASFIGYVNIVQRGTNITTDPTLGSILPAGAGSVTLIEAVTNATKVSSSVLYKITIPAEATVDFTPGTNTTVTLVYLAFTSVVHDIYIAI